MPNPSPWPLHRATTSSKPPSLLTQMTMVTSWWVSHVHLDPPSIHPPHSSQRDLLKMQIWPCHLPPGSFKGFPYRSDGGKTPHHRLQGLVQSGPSHVSTLILSVLQPHWPFLRPPPQRQLPSCHRAFAHAPPCLEHSTSPSPPPSSCLSWLTPILQPTCHLLQDTLSDFPV